MAPLSMVLPNSQDRLHTETQLKNQKLDFSAAYMAVQYLDTHMESFPESVTDNTLDALICLIKSDKFNSQKQVLFLYSKAAATLIRMARKYWIPTAKQIIPQLQKIVVSSKGPRQRAVAQALGKLPVQLTIQPVPPLRVPPPLKISLDALLSCFKEIDPLSIKWQGRSLTVRTCDNGIGVIKFAKTKANIVQLVNEIMWMDFFQKNPLSPTASFHIPCPVKIDNQYLFEFIQSQSQSRSRSHSQGSIFSGDLFNNKQIHSRPVAIAYHAHARYFEYPNENFSEKILCSDQIKEIFFRNAHLLGRLTSMGIIHTALIPLFHNRVQQGRRNDNGAYLWEQGGRLDQWLDSCRYPNFASSGLRDFEHLMKIYDSKSLCHYIGEHILSFILVIGSYFRNKLPSKRGKSQDETPVDTRDLFDSKLFFELIRGVVEQYYEGITGKKPDFKLFAGLDELTCSLIEKMGIDENMEEILRIQDQQSMGDSQFAQFLMERGIAMEEYTRGEKDIILMTGPHLGGFSQPISIPSLIEFIFCLSSMCVSDRFLMENALKTYAN